MHAGDVLVLGFANLVADGISMGFGDFVSNGTEKDAAVMERMVTEWEVANRSGPQMTQLIRYYHALGMDLHDATTVYTYLLLSLSSSSFTKIFYINFSYIYFFFFYFPKTKFYTEARFGSPLKKKNTKKKYFR